MTSATQAVGARRQWSLQSYMPFLQWLPAYDRGGLRGDIIVGITVMALLVPEGMAYAKLAGIPPQTAIAAQLPTIAATIEADPSVSADNQPSGAH